MADTPNPNPETPPAPAPGSPPPSPAVPPAPSPSAPPAPAAAVKPEGIADEFWDKDKGELKVADLGKRLNDLTAFKAEHASRAALIPEKPEAYSLDLPADFKMPDGVEFKLDPQSPLATEARALAHELKLTGPEFGRFLQLYAKEKIHEHEQVQGLATKEMEKLGAKSAERVDAVTTWLKARIGESATQVLHSQMYTASQIEAWEGLMSQFRNAGMPGAGAQGGDGGKGLDQLTDEERSKLSFEERWNRAEQADPARKASAGRR